MASLIARKRRKVNPVVESSSQEYDQGRLSSSSPVSGHSDVENEAPERASGTSRASKKEAQKPRRRVHIVRNTSLAEDEFFSQLPTASQGPHRIRGAYWKKSPPNHPPSPPLPVVDVPPVEDEETERSSSPRLDSPTDRHPMSVERAAVPSAPSLNPNPQPAATATPMPPPASTRWTPSKFNQTTPSFDTALLSELADFPLDMLSSPAEGRPVANGDPIVIDSQQALPVTPFSQVRGPGRVVAPHSNLRQTTLFGTQVAQSASSGSASQTNRVHNWPLVNSNQEPTHHKLDDEALKTWVYPTNLGAIRDYQYNIVARGLFNNLLVALPTGLGKTFIAAAIMLNWYRWTTEAQIVFVAPTRPLVAQQVNACFHIAGIPRSTTSLLTGNVSPGLRAEEWTSKRVFFMTPQTFVNDLKTGICDPKKIVLVVVDEAHRATGNYSYVEVVRFLRRFNNSFRVLALTATPGSTIESVQEVIDGLGIARTEIRTEDSIDIRQYVHQRNIDSMLFDYSDDTQFVMDMLSNAIKPVLQVVNGINAYWSKDPMTLTAFGCMQARQKWMQSPAGRGANFGLKGMVNSVFTTLASLAHAIELLKFHGIGPFYNKILAYQNEDEENGKKGSKYKKQIIQHADFKTMTSTVRGWMGKEDFLGHPKLEYLSQVVLNHFIDAGEGRGVEPDVSPAATRIMIFAHYRDSAEEIVRVLKRHSPMVRPHVFVGQAASRAGNEGMDQKKQQAIIEDFKKGVYNTLIATSIGEEGLDIGQVDLIVCYDASASPIRMLQRMGRTGRKRAGNIVVLLMRKKEHDNFEKAKDNYEKMQQMIAEGTRFVYHPESSPRIVPRGVNPEVDKRAVEIPIENSQADGELPEPKKKGRAPKRPPKRFNMPDGVVTGFLKASEVGKDGTIPTPNSRKSEKRMLFDPVPDIETCLLTASQEADLERNYLDVGGDEIQTVEYPRLDQFADLQRQERPSKLVGHGVATWRVIQLLNTMHDMVDDDWEDPFERGLDDRDRTQVDDALAGRLSPPDEPKESHIPSFDLIDNITPGRRSAKKQGRPAKRAQKKTAAPRPAKTRRRMQSSQVESTHAPSSSVAGTEGEGIDLMHTDDEHEFDDENDDDNGSDLVDFIDDATQVQQPSSSTLPPESSPRAGGTPYAQGRGSRQRPIMSSQATDATLPDAQELLGLTDPPHSEDTPRPAKRQRQRNKRAVVEEDSEDE